MDKFPLWAVLILYEKSPKGNMFRDSFVNLRILIDWLKPIDTLPAKLYPIRHLTRLESNYQIKLISEYLSLSPSKFLDYYNDVIKRNKL